MAERFGLIAYAPYFADRPEVGGRLADEWVISSTTWPAAASAVVFAAFSAILQRARRQSEQLAEMTRVLRQMFGRYMSTEVTGTLLEDPGALELGGERRTVTMVVHGAGVQRPEEPPPPPHRVSLPPGLRRALEPDHALRLASPAG